jgi:predicted HAD superfamily Cof-like phosphohydrolase
MNMSTEAIELWHKRARPEPTAADFNVQLGCHFEEFDEMLDALTFGDEEFVVEDMRELLSWLADRLKSGKCVFKIKNRNEFLDSIADQVVTGIGAAYCAGMKAADACERVNTSNWSKFDHNGQPIRDANGKITKGPNYQPPVLDGLY